MVKILDDFMFGHVSKSLCLDIHVKLLNYLNIPIAWDKTSEEPSQVIVCLGVQLNSRSREMFSCLPLEKLQKYSNEVEQSLTRSSIRIRELQSLIGQIQFATCVATGGMLS